MKHHSCSFQPWLSPYLDGELAEGQTRRIEAHLEACDLCRTELEALQTLSDRITALPTVDPSPGFDRTFWARIAESEEKQTTPDFLRRFFGGWRSLPAAAAVAVILLLAGTWKLQQSIPWQPPEDVLVAANMELLEDYDIVNHLELLENWEEINTLEAVGSG